MIEEQRINDYLSSLRDNLSPITLGEREEILREISAHIRDSAAEPGANVATVLARLGPPAALAAQYRDERLITRASRSISPVLLLRATLRLASKGVFGALVFFCGLFGYAMGGGIILTGIVKGILPANTGTWVSDGRIVSSGVLFPPPPPPAHEILGWLYIPLALTAGSLLLLLTTFSIRAFLGISRRWQSGLGGSPRQRRALFTGN